MKSTHMASASALVALATLASGAVASDAKTAPGSLCRLSLGSLSTSADFRGIESPAANTDVTCPLIRDTVGDPMTDVWIRINEANTIDSDCYVCSVSPFSFPAAYDCSASENTTATGGNSIHIDTSTLDHYENGQYGVHCSLGSADWLMSIKWQEP